MPKFYFANLSDVTVNEVTYKNIYTRVHIKELFKGNNDLFNSYKLRPDLGVQELAQILYGSKNYYWVVLLSNDITDWLYDVPLSDFELRAQVDKYMLTAPTGTNPNTIYTLFQEENEAKANILSLKPELLPSFLDKVKELYGKV